jgi:hypothetical protein
MGLYDWSGNNPIIPELWLVPHFLPIHPGTYVSQYNYQWNFVLGNAAPHKNEDFEDKLEKFWGLGERKWRRPGRPAPRARKVGSGHDFPFCFQSGEFIFTDAHSIKKHFLPVQLAGFHGVRLGAAAGWKNVYFFLQVGPVFIDSCSAHSSDTAANKSESDACFPITGPVFFWHRLVHCRRRPNRNSWRK